MRPLTIVVLVVGIIGAIALIAVSVQWQEYRSEGELGPSEAQQQQQQEQTVQKSVPPDQLSEAQVRRYQEQLEAAGFSTGAEKGRVTAETEVALRAYQERYGLPPTGILDEATQHSLAAGQMLAPGRATEGESVPGGTAPTGSAR